MSRFFDYYYSRTLSITIFRISDFMIIKNCVYKKFIVEMVKNDINSCFLIHY
jgi:hypothetical protein